MAVMAEMRRRMTIIMIILVVAFLITIVFSWGMGGFKGKFEPGVIGKVNGVKITQEEYQNARENRMAYEQQQAGEKELTPNQITQIYNEVWDGLVNNILFEQYRKNAGIEMSPGELSYAVIHYPLPQIRNMFINEDTGQFDSTRYRAFLSDPMYEQQVIYIESEMRNQLLQQKMLQRISSGVHVSEQEAKEKYIRNNTLAEASYILVDYRDLEVDSNAVTNAMIQAEYQKRKEEFLQVERRNVQFVLFEDKPSTEDTLYARQDIERVKERLVNGESFDELAADFSMDAGNADNGGDLGWFGDGRMVQEFWDASRTAEIGEIVGPVQTRFGYHLIRVDSTRGKDESYEVKARHILIKIERSQQTLGDLRREADGFRDEAEESNFEKAAQVYEVNVDTLEGLTHDGFIPQFGRNQAATEFLFNRPKGDVSPVYYFRRQGFVVMRVIEVDPEHYRPVDEVRETLVKDLEKEKALELAGEKAKEVYAKVKSAGSLEAGAEASGEEVKKTKRAFKIDDFVSGVGRDYAFTATAFSLEPDEISEPVEGSKGWYIIRLDSKTPANISLWDRQKDSKMGEMSRELQQQVFQSWIDAARERAKIEDFRYFYYTEF